MSVDRVIYRLEDLRLKTLYAQRQLMLEDVLSSPWSLQLDTCVKSSLSRHRERGCIPQVLAEFTRPPDRRDSEWKGVGVLR